MITRIHIENYKSFRKLELKLNPLTVIFGPNSSGKSNLLDALYFLSRGVTRKNLGEAFDGHRGLPIESTYDPGEDGTEESGRIVFEIDVHLSSSVISEIERIINKKREGIDAPVKKTIISEPRLRYRLGIEVQRSTGYLRVMSECLSAIKKNGQEKARKPFIDVDPSDSTRLILRMEGQARPTTFQIGMDSTCTAPGSLDTALRLTLPPPVP